MYRAPALGEHVPIRSCLLALPPSPPPLPPTLSPSNPRARAGTRPDTAGDAWRAQSATLDLVVTLRHEGHRHTPDQEGLRAATSTPPEDGQEGRGPRAHLHAGGGRGSRGAGGGGEGGDGSGGAGMMVMRVQLAAPRAGDAGARGEAGGGGCGGDAGLCSLCRVFWPLSRFPASGLGRRA